MSDPSSDPFERNVSSLLRSGPTQGFAFALVGAGGLLVATFRLGPLVFAPSAIVAFFVFYYCFAAQLAAIAWLAKRHRWEPHLRALLAALVLLTPLLVLIGVVMIASG